MASTSATVKLCGGRPAQPPMTRCPSLSRAKVRRRIPPCRMFTFLNVQMEATTQVVPGILEERLYQHQSGIGSNHTRLRLPVTLMFSEEYDRIDEAFAREKQIQGWSHQKKKALIEGNFEGLVRLSKNYTQYGKPDDTESG